MQTTHKTQDDKKGLTWQAIINSIKPTDINVSVEKGIVTLTGLVDTYAKKQAAEKAASEISGIKMIINRIEVSCAGGDQKDDAQLAVAVLNEVNRTAVVLQSKINFTIKEGWLNIEGEVECLDGKKVKLNDKICRLDTGTMSTGSEKAIANVERNLEYWEIFA